MCSLSTSTEHSTAGRQQQRDLETVTGIRAAAEHDVAEEVVREENEGREGHEGVTAARTGPREQQAAAQQQQQQGWEQPMSLRLT